MKKLVLISIAAFALVLTSCRTEDKKEECIHCTGCFSSWDECESDYTPTEADPSTWEEHSYYMVNNPGGATWVCTPAN